MTAIGRELTSVVFSASAGLGIGVLVDHWAPPPASVTDANWVRVLVEVAAQLTANGVLAAAWFETAARRGFASGASNPLAGGIPFLLAVHASQSNLKSKLEGLAGFSKSKLDGWLNPPTTGEKANQIQGVREGQTMKYA